MHPAMQRVAGEGTELLGTIAYTAPEVLQDASQLQMPSDVYAFGLLSEIPAQFRLSAKKINCRIQAVSLFASFGG